jgi:hypothetical protein
MGREIDGLLESPWRDEFGTEVAKRDLRFRGRELRNRLVRSRIEAILIKILRKSNDDILRGAAIANLCGRIRRNY